MLCLTSRAKRRYQRKQHGNEGGQYPNEAHRASRKIRGQGLEKQGVDSLAIKINNYSRTIDVIQMYTTQIHIILIKIRAGGEKSQN